MQNLSWLHLAGFGLMFGLGPLLLWFKPELAEGGSDEMTWGKFRIRASHPGVLCIALGAILLILGEFRTGGSEDEVSPLGSLRLGLGATLLAQERPLAADEGWTFLDPSIYQTLVADVSRNVEIMQARRDVPLRADHFDALTGTLLGSVLGYRRPDVVATVEKGECIRVVERETVGVIWADKVWLRAQKIECEPFLDAIEEAVQAFDEVDAPESGEDSGPPSTK